MDSTVANPRKEARATSDPAAAEHVTGRLARYVHGAQWQDLPEHVRHEAVRSVVNWVGCAYGGSNSAAVQHAIRGLQEVDGGSACTVLGTPRRWDPLNAALLNGLSVSAHAFDDAHLATVAHPGAPTVAALLAYAEQHRVSGGEFLLALALSNELQCRLSCALALPPANCELGWYMTGVTGAVGVAAGVGKLMGLSEQQLCWAMGLAAMQAGGLRASHGSMSCALIPGQAGREGLLAAHLAAANFSCHDDAIGAGHGLLQLFAKPANPDALTARLGEHWECMSVSLKPFPSGCLTHAVIDACLQLVRGHVFSSTDISRIELSVHRLAEELTGRRTPQHSYDAQASIYHWAAAVLHRRKAGLEESVDACVHDPEVVALRQRVTVTVHDGLTPDAARAAVTLRDGRRIESSVGPCIGSAERPMTDAELDAKLLRQATGILGAEEAQRLSRCIWGLNAAADVGRAGPGFWGPATFRQDKETQ